MSDRRQVGPFSIPTDRMPAAMQAKEALDRAAAKADPRRFTGEPVTAFGGLHPVFAAIAEAHRLGPIFTPEEEAVIEAQYAQEEATEQEVRSIAELAEDHLYQRQEMEDADERAGLE